MHTRGGDRLEIGHFCKFWTSVAFLLMLDRVIWHTVVNHSSTSTYIPNFILNSENFLWTGDRRTYSVHHTQVRVCQRVCILQLMSN